jgi:hypothetical protein
MDAEAKLSRALTAPPELARAHYFMGRVPSMTNRAERGMKELDRATGHDPCPGSCGLGSGEIRVDRQRAEATEAHVLEALRLSPRDESSYMWLQHVSQAKTYLGEFVQALPCLRKSIDANRNWPWGVFILVACLANLGISLMTRDAR